MSLKIQLVLKLLLWQHAVLAKNEKSPCPTSLKSQALRNDLSKALNLAFRGLPSMKAACIPDMTNLKCEEIRSDTSASGRKRTIEKCIAQVTAHSNYWGNFKVDDYESSALRRGKKCYFIFKIRTFRNKKGIKRSKLQGKHLKNKCRLEEKATWEDFGPWSACGQGQEKKCGELEQMRLRRCSVEGKCQGSDIEIRTCFKPCSTKPSPLWSEWSEWSTCSKTCGGGTRIRNRYCQNGPCLGDKEEGEVCNKEKCPKKKPESPWSSSSSAQKSEGRKFDFISWPQSSKDCKFYEFYDQYGRRLSKSECQALLDSSPNRLYPLTTKECLEKNFYLKDDRRLSNSECVEIVDRRTMFIIKSAKKIQTRDPENEEECRSSDFFYSGKFLSTEECIERLKNLESNQLDEDLSEYDDDYGVGPRSRKDCEEYEFFWDDRILTVQECLRLLAASQRRQRQRY
ncbi:Oidioi.mRNA.OKI2018_I69.chr1.g1035.t1.cds [Oikopleura dioica]|uniref:Oidioi.mRNA.OKI2018_I69.chr1.g1035.t1.cds n=1 Tax=Oikopleura dioica TaxID=34765 RepID=A0ABN7SLP5_OIKDI|nr:Oidioi.mRNA.OKI2018_I69.chr1.g1035.t1.cds [Oikopleura dioica]